MASGPVCDQTMFQVLGYVADQFKDRYGVRINSTTVLSLGSASDPVGGHKMV